MTKKKSQEIRVISSEYNCGDIIQGEACNPLFGMLPFSSYVFKNKRKEKDNFGGAGLYACFYRNHLIYVGKYLGTTNDFRSGNIISLRWVKHIGTFTMMARNLSFTKKAMRQIIQGLESGADTIPQPIRDAFPATSFKMITRDRSCVSSYARFDVATRIWCELGQPSLDWLKEFNFIYTKIDTDLPCAEVRVFISRAEDIAVSKLRPPGNSIKDRDWNTYSRDDVLEVFTDSLSCSYKNKIDTAITPTDESLLKVDSEPEEESNSMKFEEMIEISPQFAKEFIEKVKQEFTSVDDASIEYTKRPDMRVRKITGELDRGFINAATIRWQSRNKRFLLGTALSLGEVERFGLNAFTEKSEKILPSVVSLDESIINELLSNVLDLLKYAHETR